MRDLPEAILRFEPATVESGLLDASAGAVQGCVVVIDGQDVAVLTLAELTYTQKGGWPGSWSIVLFADPTEPLSRTIRWTGA